jgi:hypothetical protein
MQDGTLEEQGERQPEEQEQREQPLQEAADEGAAYAGLSPGLPSIAVPSSHFDAAELLEAAASPMAPTSRPSQQHPVQLPAEEQEQEQELLAAKQPAAPGPQDPAALPQQPRPQVADAAAPAARAQPAARARPALTIRTLAVPGSRPRSRPAASSTPQAQQAAKPKTPRSPTAWQHSLRHPAGSPPSAARAASSTGALLPSLLP